MWWTPVSYVRFEVICGFVSLGPTVAKEPETQLRRTDPWAAVFMGRSRWKGGLRFTLYCHLDCCCYGPAGHVGVPRYALMSPWLQTSKCTIPQPIPVAPQHVWQALTLRQIGSSCCSGVRILLESNHTGFQRKTSLIPDLCSFKRLRDTSR